MQPWELTKHAGQFLLQTIIEILAYIQVLGRTTAGECFVTMHVAFIFQGFSYSPISESYSPKQ